MVFFVRSNVLRCLAISISAESQKKAEEEAKYKDEEETKRIEKAKKASENETRNQIAAEVGSSRYKVEMLEKLKAIADSGSKVAEMALKDESISLKDTASSYMI